MQLIVLRVMRGFSLIPNSVVSPYQCIFISGAENTVFADADMMTF